MHLALQRVGHHAPVISSRLSLLVAVVVAVALAALALACLVALLQHPVQHAAWRTGLSAVALTGVWWLLNGPLEGPTLVVVSHSHGFTAGDALGVPALLLGGAVLGLAVRT